MAKKSNGHSQGVIDALKQQAKDLEAKQRYVIRKRTELGPHLNARMGGQKVIIDVPDVDVDDASIIQNVYLLRRLFQGQALKTVVPGMDMPEGPVFLGPVANRMFGKPARPLFVAKQDMCGPNDIDNVKYLLHQSGLEKLGVFIPNVDRLREAFDMARFYNLHDRIQTLHMGDGVFDPQTYYVTSTIVIGKDVDDQGRQIGQTFHHVAIRPDGDEILVNSEDIGARDDVKIRLFSMPVYHACFRAGPA